MRHFFASHRDRLLSACIVIAILFLSRSIFPADSKIISGATQDRYPDSIAIVTSDAEVGQGFQVDESSFDSIAFYIQTLSPTNHPFIFRIYANDDTEPIAMQAINLAQAQAQAVFRVRFPAINRLGDGQYRFSLQSTSPDDQLIIGGTSWNSYAGGNITGGDNPNGDMAFVVYHTPSFLSIIGDGLTTLFRYRDTLWMIAIWLFCSSVLIWKLVAHFAVDRFLLLTITIAVAPLVTVVQWFISNIVPIPFEPIIIILLAVLLVIASLRGQSPLSNFKSMNHLHILSVTIVSGFILISQFSFIAEMDLPPYVDSVHHVLLTDHITETQSANFDLADFRAGDGVFFYHTGFHAFASAINRLGGQSPQTLLVLGAVLLWLFALSLYSLTRVIGGDHWVALLAMLLATFAFQMPTSLLDWGKYPLIFAISNFGAIISLLWLSTQDKSSPRWSQFAIGMLLACTILIHTRLLFVWVIVGLGLLILLSLRKGLRNTLIIVSPFILSAILVIGLWFYPRWQAWNQAQSSTAIAYENIPTAETFAFPKLTTIEYSWLLFLVVGFVVSGKKYLALKLGIAGSLLAFIIIPLIPSEIAPGGAFFNLEFASAFITVPLVLGLALIAHILNAGLGRETWVVPTAIAVIIIGGLTGRNPFPSACCQIADHTDIEAFAWIESNIEPNTRWGIAVMQWTDGQVVGVDGGYWLNAYQAYTPSLPSLLYGFDDALGQRRITEEAQQIDQAIRDGQTICELPIDYIYVGSRAESFIRPLLQTNPHTRTIYQNQSVAILEVVDCSQK